jgi:hypothetical protein
VDVASISVSPTSDFVTSDDDELAIVCSVGRCRSRPEKRSSEAPLGLEMHFFFGQFVAHAYPAPETGLDSYIPLGLRWDPTTPH